MPPNGGKSGSAPARSRPPPDPPESEHDLANFVEDAHLLDEEELAMEIEDLKKQWAEQLRAPKQPAKKSSSRRKKP